MIQKKVKIQIWVIQNVDTVELRNLNNLILQELLQIEENWQRETRELVKTVSRLQDENTRLRSNLVDTKQAVAEEIAVVAKSKMTDTDLRESLYFLQDNRSGKF